MNNLEKLKKTEKTKRKLKHAFIKLYKEKKRLDDITVIELCELSDCTRTTFYAYFNNIYDLLQEIENELLSMIDAILSKRDLNAIKNYKMGEEIPNIYQQTYEHLAEYSDYYSVLTGEYGDPLFVYKLKKMIRKNIEEVFSCWDSECKDIGICSVFISSAIVDVIPYWLTQRPELSAQEVASLMGQLMIGSANNLKK